MSTDRPVRAADEWRRVTLNGTYVADESVVIRYQTRDGASGVDIVTPLRTEDGSSVLVDRGWMRTGNVGSDQVDAPAPPAGDVTVVGFVRADATGDATEVTDSSARSISSRAIEGSTDLTLYRRLRRRGARDTGAVEAAGEDRAARPRQRAALLLRPAVVVLRPAGGRRLLLPRLGRASQGPRTHGRSHRARSMPPSIGSIAPVTKLAAGESRNAAARPNSSGCP